LRKLQINFYWFGAVLCFFGNRPAIEPYMKALQLGTGAQRKRRPPGRLVYILIDPDCCTISEL
jgi:hypothetical protein